MSDDDAYGQQTVLAADSVTVRPASSYGNQIGFTGRYLDGESGLWYFRARMYSGSLGRFIGRDRKGYIGGDNLYLAYFVPNKIDNTGLAAGDVTAGPPQYLSPGYIVELLWELPNN